jgi:hypothetical protein
MAQKPKPTESFNSGWGNSSWPVVLSRRPWFKESGRTPGSLKGMICKKLSKPWNSSAAVMNSATCGLNTQSSVRKLLTRPALSNSFLRIFRYCKED